MSQILGLNIFQKIVGLDSYKEWPVSYVCVRDVARDGTSGTAVSLLAVEHKISERFLVSMADGFCMPPTKFRFHAVTGVAALVYTRLVDDPSSFGVVTRMTGGDIQITERPHEPTSKEALVGVYIFEPEVFRLCRQVRPSIRGELELTDVLRMYAQQDALEVKCLPEDAPWVDMGTANGVIAAESQIITCGNSSELNSSFKT